MNKTETILTVHELSKHFPVYKGLILRQIKGYVKAVNKISFQLQKGETLGIIGESGCGKTTLSRMIMGLIDATAGHIKYRDKTINTSIARETRKNIQMIFQDPYGSLDPRMSVQKIIEEPLRVHEKLSQTEKREIVLPLLKQVGLAEDSLDKYPHEFSGGQRQRVGIARALITQPEILVCDEPVSALDVSIQAQILNLLRELQQKRSLAYLFVSHDMAVIRFISDRVLVMYLGHAMELASKNDLFERAAHPYTQALMKAVPIPDPKHKQSDELLKGEIPNPLELPQGCPFHQRCKHSMEICREEYPSFIEVAPKHQVACHLYKKDTRND